MSDLTNAIWIELRKVTRSRMPRFTVLGLLLLPLGVAFIMFVVKDPELARKVGLISTKANLMDDQLIGHPILACLPKQ